MHSKLNIICPNPAIVLAEEDSSIREEQLYANMWIVEKHEYDTCTVNTSISSSFMIDRNLLQCDTPYELKSYKMVFRTYSMGDLEFQPGKKYYFIGKSSVFILKKNQSPISVNLHLSKVLFSLDPDNLQLHCFLGLEALFCCSFFCSLRQPCKTLQMARAYGRTCEGNIKQHSV